MNKPNIYITDNRHFTSVIERYLSESNTHSPESVGLSELFKYLGPNDFACRAVLKITDKDLFEEFAKATYLNFTYTDVETREEFVNQLNSRHDPLKA